MNSSGIPAPPLWSGCTSCHGPDGQGQPCPGSGQDAEFRPGLPWPAPRFLAEGEGLVGDALTGLVWTRSANPFTFPMSWQDALGAVSSWNMEARFGRTDWRVPNRVELRSIVSHGAARPALPQGHPFTDVFQGWVWTSTTAAIAPTHAWRVHLEGARTFYGRKTDESLIWPVAGRSLVLPWTGQGTCFAQDGRPMPCLDAPGQDGAFRFGVSWPSPRFDPHGTEALDRLTGLVWRREPLSEHPLDWVEALQTVQALARSEGVPWRLPSITELDSLVDCSRHSPALPEGHPFLDPPEACWSSTTSPFGHDWSFCLYIAKGAVGVGYKPRREFGVLVVRTLS